MKVLITGGAGFIGSEVVRRAVSRGLKVTVVDKLTYAADLRRLQEVEEKCIFYPADITNREFMEYVFSEEKPEVVIHLAAESHVDRSLLEPERFLKSNVLGTQVLLDLSLKYKVRKFLNVSTDEVYGELGPEGAFTEEAPLRPNSPYAVSKAAADMLGRAYFRSYGLPVITVRPCNNYGPWQYPEKLIPLTILKALKNENIPVYGKGENVREWLFVSDCAEALLLILERGRPGDIYNLGSGFEITNLKLVQKILEILGKPRDLIKFVKDRPGHDFRYRLDSSRLGRELGWKVKTSLEEGLEKTIRWYRQHHFWLEEKEKNLRYFWESISWGN